MTLASFPTMTYQVDFAHDPASGSFTWTDLTTRTLGFSCVRGRAHELTSVDAGSAQVNWQNTDGALDPTNTGSAYSPNVIPFRRVQVKATWSGTTYNIYTGLVERWPLQWAAEFGTVPSQCTDVFAVLANKTLRSVYEQEVLVDAPVVFYPLTEATGSTSAGDISGNGWSALTVAQLGGVGDVTFGGATGVPTDGTSTLSLNTSLSSSAADDFNGDYLLPHSRVTWTSAQTNSTLEAWVTISGTLVTAMSRNSTRLVPVVALDLLSLWALCLGYSAGAIKVADQHGVTYGNDLNDGHLHHLAISSTSLGSVIYVDGVQVGTGSGASLVGGADLQVNVGAFDSTVAVGGASPVPASPAFRGGLGYVAAYPSVLSAGRIAAHYTAGVTAFAGETANARIGRLLGYAGWTATTALDACTTTMLAATDIKGQTALSAIQSVQQSEGGAFYVGKDGTLTYKTRTSRMSTTASSYTFGDGTGELPYTSVTFEDDTTFIYNDIQISRTGASSAAATDATSQGHYGQRTYTKTLSIQSDSVTLDAANWFLNEYKTWHLRVQALTLDPSSDPALWPAVLNMDIGTRVTVKRRPHGSTNTISADYFVEQVAHNVQPGVWTATVALSPVALQALIADDTTFGICDSTFVAAW